MDKTVKLYYNSPYQKDFSSKVVECAMKNGKCEVVLESSCFYPGGGGQPPDMGFLNDEAVVDCYINDGIIYHVLENDICCFKTEDIVCGRANFDRRYAFMQNHTGEHILSGLAEDCYNAKNVGFHMSDRGITMDFDKALSKEMLDNLEILANKAVNKAIDVKITETQAHKLQEMNVRSKKEFGDYENVRLVDIAGYDLCACAGLHVANTCEVNILKIASYQKYKGGVRLNVYCGTDAMWDYTRKNALVKEMSGMLSADIDNISAALDRLLVSAKAQKKEIDSYKNIIFQMRADTIAPGASIAYFFEDNLDDNDLRHFANICAEKAQISIVFSKQGERYKYAACTKDAKADLQSFVQKLNSALEGRGGAKNTSASGAVNANYALIADYLEGLA